MILIFTILIFFVSYEAIMWGWTLNRHAIWLSNHISDKRRLLVSFKMLRTASIMISILSAMAWLWWIIILTTTITYSSHLLIYALIISIIQLSHIHFSVLIARYACLPRSFWTIFSKYISIFLCKYFNAQIPILTSKDLHICWGKDFKKC